MKRKDILDELSKLGIGINNNTLENDELLNILESIKNDSSKGLFNKTSDIPLEVLSESYPCGDIEEEYLGDYDKDLFEFPQHVIDTFTKDIIPDAVQVNTEVKELGEWNQAEFEEEEGNVVVDEDLKIYKDFKRNNFIGKQGINSVIHDIIFKAKENFDIPDLITIGQQFPNAELLLIDNEDNTYALYSGDPKEAFDIAEELIKTHFNEVDINNK